MKHFTYLEALLVNGGEKNAQEIFQIFAKKTIILAY